MKTINAFFLSHGRSTRSQWLCRLVALGAACAALSTIGPNTAALLAAVFVWSALAMSVQRLHDTGLPGWTLFLLLMPVAGPLTVLFLLVRRGQQDPNRYGAPWPARAGYATVDLAK